MSGQRAGDDDRDQLLRVLQQAYAAGRLDQDEFNERQDKALRVKYSDEMLELVEDLPERSELGILHEPQTQGRAVASHNPQLPANAHHSAPSISILSGKDIVLAPGTRLVQNFSFWAGDDIYLDEVMGPGVELVLELPAIMAGHDIYVPPGVRIIDECTAIMAGNGIDKPARGDGSNGTLILRGLLFWAGHDIHLTK